MPRYLFRICDRDRLETALDAPDLDAARQAAARFLARMLAERADDFWRSGEWLLEASDESGLALFNVRLFTSEAPSVQACPQPDRAPDR